MCIIYVLPLNAMYMHCRKTFKDSDNQSVLNILIQEVKGLNPTFLTQHIRGM